MKGKNIPEENSFQKKNIISENKYLHPITTESEFYDFREWCSNQNINGIENELSSLRSTEISRNMVDFIIKFYGDMKEKNYYDRNAIAQFIEVRENVATKRQQTDLIAELGGNYFSTPQGLCFYYGKNMIPIEIDSAQFEGLISEIKYEADGRPANGEEILAIRRLARYYASKNVKSVEVRVTRDENHFFTTP